MSFTLYTTSSLKSSSYHGKRYRLPNHNKRNFTGTLLGEDLMCVDTMDADEGEGVGIFECHGQGRNQVTFIVTCVQGCAVPRPSAAL